MKKISIVVLLIIIMTLAMVFASCVEVKENKLTINDIKCYLKGDAVAINPVFSVKTEVISYDYDETALEILNGAVKGLKEGEFTVKAVSQSCEVTFTVFCVLPIKVADLYAWVDYPAADIAPVINVDGDAEVVYTTKSDIISINGNSVTALKKGNAEVTAEIDGFKTTFNVTCNEVDRTDRYKFYYVFPNGDDWGWKNAAQLKKLEYMQKGTDGKTTIFIGDSFFDIGFFSAFYSFYPTSSADALCLGIGGTTSNTWELILDDYFEGFNPKNVVIQLGNNNYYNDKVSVEEAAEDLQRFLTYIHAKMPDTQLYYFAITPRVMTMEMYEREVKAINKLTGEFCQSKDWVVFLDTVDEMTKDPLWTGDNIHPKPAKYQIFVDALKQAGLVIEEK